MVGQDHVIEEEPATPTVEKPELPTPVASVKSSLFSRSSEKSINLATCKDRALRPLTPSLREYLKIFSPTFPAWLEELVIGDLAREDAISFELAGDDA